MSDAQVRLLAITAVMCGGFWSLVEGMDFSEVLLPITFVLFGVEYVASWIPRRRKRGFEVRCACGYDLSGSLKAGRMDCRLAWDADEDVDVLLEEYYEKFYGPAAEPMRAFWSACERGYALLRPGPDTHKRFAALPGIWDQLDGYLREAEAAVASAEQRYRERIQLHRDGLEFGRFRHEFETRYQTGSIDSLGLGEEFGGPGSDRSKTVDPQAAIATLREKEAWLKALQTKYKPAGDYYPTLVNTYFYPDVGKLVGEIEAATQGPVEP